MRQRAAASDVVIVNHHLLCADASVRQSAYGEVIPSCTRVILDEAHQLEDIATQYFGFSVSNYRVEELARDVERLGVDDRKAKDEIAKALDRLRDHGARLLHRARLRASRRRAGAQRRAHARHV
jgi:ATP-dependent DNA helicase DinG